MQKTFKNITNVVAKFNFSNPMGQWRQFNNYHGVINIINITFKNNNLLNLSRIFHHYPEGQRLVI